MSLDINGHAVIRDVRSHGIHGLYGAPEGALIGGPGVRAVRVTAKRFPDLDLTYVAERDQITKMRAQLAAARAAQIAKWVT